MLIECSAIVDENHPLIREAAVFSLRSITANNPNAAEVLLEVGGRGRTQGATDQAPPE